MVGCVIPNAPPTRNEDKPSSLAVKTTPRAKKKEKSGMNEKLAQALQKGKEIAVPLCIKGKELALTGYAKGNELMDKVSFLQKPLHKKIVWGVLGIVFIWMLLPAGEKSSHSAKHDFKKTRNTDALFFDGGKTSVQYGDDYVEAIPNLIKLPHNISLDTLCGAFNPELEHERHKKGVAYLNDENGTYYCTVSHVDDGFIIAEPDDKGMYGNFYGYIETDDAYVEGQRLKSGFYTLTGRKSVPLRGGAKRTMYAFKKESQELYDKVAEVCEYNKKAEEAASQENDKRRMAAVKAKQARLEKESKEREAKLQKECQELFKKELATFDENSWKKRIHMADGLKGRINISCEPYWVLGGKVSFAELKKKVENGGTDVVVYTEGNLKEAIHQVVADFRCAVTITSADDTCKWRAYLVGGLYADFHHALKYEISSTEDIYIIEINDDVELRKLGDYEINGTFGNPSKFKPAFEAKYGSKGL